MFYKVKNVTPLADFKLKVEFYSNEHKIYDVKPLFDKWTVFQNLMNHKGLFEQVQVDQGGYGISWNDEIDLSCNELYENGLNYQ